MAAETGIARRLSRNDLRAASQHGNIDSAIEERNAQHERRYSIAMFPGQALDEAVQT